MNINGDRVFRIQTIAEEPAQPSRIDRRGGYVARRLRRDAFQHPRDDAALDDLEDFNRCAQRWISLRSKVTLTIWLSTVIALGSGDCDRIQGFVLLWI